MKNAYLSLFLAAVTCFCLSDCQSETFQVDKRHASRKYCGHNLVLVMQLVCDSRYNSPRPSNPSKKSDTDDFWQQLEVQSSEQEYRFPFRSLSNAFRLMKRGGGIADECCYNKGCTYDELRSYCST
uniref:ILP6 n=1 Tax=Blattella germanica TaxID=6973 RepID=A0A445MQH8_BLAGE|nr:ILP6 [Blattella germanica]